MMKKLLAMLLLAAVLTLAAATASAADFGAINGVWTGIAREEDSFDYYVLSVRNNDAALFTAAEFDEAESERIGVSSYSYWRSTFRTFFKSKTGILSVERRLYFSL